MTITLSKLECLRCGHTWLPRTEKPRKCPHCTSPYWSKPRREKIEDVLRRQDWLIAGRDQKEVRDAKP